MCLSSFLSIHSTTSCSFISLHLSSILPLSFFLFPCRRPIPSLFRNKQQYLKCIPGHLYRSYTHYKSEVLYIFHIGENLLPPLRHNILPFQSFVKRTQSSSCRRPWSAASQWRKQAHFFNARVAKYYYPWTQFESVIPTLASRILPQELKLGHAECAEH